MGYCIHTGFFYVREVAALEADSPTSAMEGVSLPLVRYSIPRTYSVIGGCWSRELNKAHWTKMISTDPDPSQPRAELIRKQKS